MRYENLLLVILYCGYGCRVPKAIMVIMIDLMLEVSNVSMRLTVSAINPALFASCIGAMHQVLAMLCEMHTIDI